MKEKFTAVVIDDELIGVNNLSRSLAQVDKMVLVGTAMNARDGKNLVLHSKPDLIFLDIEMPDMSGLDLLRGIKDELNWPVKVVFYSGYDKYLLDGFRESAFDFLLKPYLEKDFQVVMERFFKCIENNDLSGCSNQAIQGLDKENSVCFLVPNQNGYTSCRIMDVGLFEFRSKEGRWFAILEGESIPLKKNTSAKSILRLSEYFKPISKNHIVNILFLASITGKDKKKCSLFPPFDKNNNLSISKDNYRQLQDSFYTL